MAKKARPSAKSAQTGGKKLAEQASMGTAAPATSKMASKMNKRQPSPTDSSEDETPLIRRKGYQQQTATAEAAKKGKLEAAHGSNIDATDQGKGKRKAIAKSQAAENPAPKPRKRRADAQDPFPSPRASKKQKTNASSSAAVSSGNAQLESSEKSQSEKGTQTEAQRKTERPYARPRTHNLPSSSPATNLRRRQLGGKTIPVSTTGGFEIRTDEDRAEDEAAEAAAVSAEKTQKEKEKKDPHPLLAYASNGTKDLPSSEVKRLIELDHEHFINSAKAKSSSSSANTTTVSSPAPLSPKIQGRIKRARAQSLRRYNRDQQEQHVPLIHSLLSHLTPESTTATTETLVDALNNQLLDVGGRMREATIAALMDARKSAQATLERTTQLSEALSVAWGESEALANRETGACFLGEAGAGVAVEDEEDEEANADEAGEEDGEKKVSED